MSLRILLPLATSSLVHPVTPCIVCVGVYVCGYGGGGGGAGCAQNPGIRTIPEAPEIFLHVVNALSSLLDVPGSVPRVVAAVSPP